jgi:prepilin-type processing-associated H-X9-DG protein
VLGEDDLYHQFDRNEPWGSEHNRSLIGKMPAVYAPVRVQAASGATFYQGFTGDGTFYDTRRPLRIPDFNYHNHDAIMLVEGSEAVFWTQPDDLVLDPNQPLPKLGGLFDGNYNVLLCDGSVRFMSRNTAPERLRNAISHSGLIDWSMIGGHAIQPPLPVRLGLSKEK